MRTNDIKALTAEVSDQLAETGFNRVDDSAYEWLRDAVLGEWGEARQKEVLAVLISAIRWDERPAHLQSRSGLTSAIEQLRSSYVDLSRVHGTYSEKAYQSAVDQLADAREAIAELRAEEAAQAAIRG